MPKLLLHVPAAYLQQPPRSKKAPARRRKREEEEEQREEEEEDRGNGQMIKQSLETLSASEDLKSGTLNCKLRAGTPHWSETRKAELPPSATETLNPGSG